MSSGFLKLSCPAKVNLALSVGSPDANGMHPIASWMVALSLADELSLTKRAGLNSAFSIQFSTEEQDAASVAGRDVDWPLQSDLAFKAHALMEEHTGRRLPVLLKLTKRIPTGAGLGGGSSNAAMTLVGLSRLFDLNLSVEELIALSSKLGSDIAFFVRAAHGDSSLLVSGLGDSLEDRPRESVLHLVLILPDFGCPTGPVYGAFDRLHGFNKSSDSLVKTIDMDRVRTLADSETVAQDGPFNDLADAACEVEPRLAEARQQLSDALALPVHVTGSGSAMFVIAPSAITAKPLARKVTSLTSLRAVSVRSV